MFQQFSLLQTTLAENTAQTFEASDEPKMWDCIEKAGLTKKVNSLYKDAPIIVLDEPTAALDPIAEAANCGRPRRSIMQPLLGYN